MFLTFVILSTVVLAFTLLIWAFFREQKRYGNLVGRKTKETGEKPKVKKDRTFLIAPAMYLVFVLVCLLAFPAVRYWLITRPMAFVGTQTLVMLLFAFAAKQRQAEATGGKSFPLARTLTAMACVCIFVYSLPYLIGSDPPQYWSKANESRKAARMERMKQEAEERVMERITAEERQIVIWAPPAPGWSKPMNRKTISAKSVKIDSPRREYRYRTDEGIIGVASDLNSPTYKTNVLEFQSTSPYPEKITISW